MILYLTRDFGSHNTNVTSVFSGGLIKMTEALVTTRNVYGTSSLEAALSRLHIGIAYLALYEDIALREYTIYTVQCTLCNCALCGVRTS